MVEAEFSSELSISDWEMIMLIKLLLLNLLDEIVSQMIPYETLSGGGTGTRGW